jgi:class 3 adenylate cyclase
MMTAWMRGHCVEALPIMKRKIAAILAADIVGYSRLVAEDEEETIRRLAVCRGIFDELSVRYGGRIVNTVGDSILADFPSSVDAVRCSIDIQESIRARNLAYPPSRQMTFRIGITVGDVVDRDGQLFGDAVNVAARLEGLAPGGGICVSRSVYEQAAHNVSARFVDIGQQQVKNISNPVHAHMIAPYPGEAGDRSRKGAATRSKRVLAGATVVAALLIAAVAAAVLLPKAPGPSATSVPASQQVIRHFDDAKVRALAASQGIPLPPVLKILVPAPTVPAKLVDYLGAWGGDKRWNRGGRQAVLVVESVDSSGTALGVYAQGPPANPLGANPPPARHAAFVGAITDKGLAFAWGPAKYTFHVMPDGTMWGKREAGNEQARFDLTITLERIE